MYIVLFVKNTHLAREYSNILLLKVCIIGDFILIFLFLPPKNLFYNVHISNVHKTLSNALLILAKSFVHVYLNPSNVHISSP